MRLNDVFDLESYGQAYEYANKKGYIISEIDKGADGERRFQIVKKPSPTEEDMLCSLRSQRECECFAIVNRGNLWYESLNVGEYSELKKWYQAWLDVTQTRVIPEKPNWLN